jgi:hypothetical protein
MMRKLLVVLVKAFHTIAFVVIQTCILYLIYAGVRRRTDARAAMAVAVAAAESAIYVGNGFRCPLTGLAERLGAQKGQVTDIFLPKWLANNIANIYSPLFVLGLYLNGRNLLERRADDGARGARA